MERYFQLRWFPTLSGWKLVQVVNPSVVFNGSGWIEFNLTKDTELCLIETASIQSSLSLWGKDWGEPARKSAFQIHIKPSERNGFKRGLMRFWWNSGSFITPYLSFFSCSLEFRQRFRAIKVPLLSVVTLWFQPALQCVLLSPCSSRRERGLGGVLCLKCGFKYSRRGSTNDWCF